MIAQLRAQVRRRGLLHAERDVHHAIESSTVMPCTPLAWWSFSVRPRHGQDQRALAVDEVAAVELRAHLHGQLAAAAAPRTCTRGVGRGEREVAAHARRTPSRRRGASPRSSRPCRARARAAGRCRRRRASRSRNSGVGRWSMPQVRLPCTLLCPRIGHGPAPSRPMLPRSSSRLTISRTVSTPCSCCVMPEAPGDDRAASTPR